ncbi:hypothetical protein O0L34_g8188 [Tuta absoluta]|nr:hypothetical protein O0L34_g8188 [Tuta absoluta]
MVSSRIIASAACLLVFQICRIQSQAISTEAYSSATSVSGPSQYGCGGGQIIIPAIITPVMPEAASTSSCSAAPYVPNYSGGYGGACSMPPIIIEEGCNGKNDLFLPLILILALRNNGGGLNGNGNNGFSGGFNYPAPGFGYGYGFGNTGYGCNCNSCGCNDYCNGCGYDCSNNTPTVNIVVSAADATTTTAS